MMERYPEIWVSVSESMTFISDRSKP